MDKGSEALYDKTRWEPTYYKSRKWYEWKSLLTDRTCDTCKNCTEKSCLAMCLGKRDRQSIYTVNVAL